MTLPRDYTERVYAGVLGKIIGVYLGRPFEGWYYDHIMRELGEIQYYVHEKRGVPLIVTDDDISGTFTFLRALPDYDNRRDLTPQQIAQTWLNYIIEERTILWWGGLGNSTEHTAFLRLKQGTPAPQSGSIALNGKVVAEQIGAQIFIDGWAMVAPGDPALAANFARRAGSVSHDGEAIYGAQVLAAMEAQAFVEGDANKLLDVGASFIPKDSIIYRMIGDIREWRAKESDWRKTREKIEAHYGYHIYGGNCHMIPNHALIILGLLYGGDDFQKSLMIVNTAGWDTDCNSGNLGCLLGIKNGLAGLESGPDWRGPVADRMYLPTADGGRAISDAVSETFHVVNVGRALAGESPVSPKEGARYHFELPGSVQGFMVESGPDSGAEVTLENVEGHSRKGQRSLALHFKHAAPGAAARAATAVFVPPEAINMIGYKLLASPALYSGQTVTARVEADKRNLIPITCQLYIRVYGANDELVRVYGPRKLLKGGGSHQFEWKIGSTHGAPIAEIGLEVSAKERADGAIYLDELTWSGEPDVVLARPAHGGQMWRRAWVDGVDSWPERWAEPYRIMQNHGRGLIIQGTRDWKNYQVSATITPHMVTACGISARVQGLRRYYALLLSSDGKARLVKALDGDAILAEKAFKWEFGQSHLFKLEAVGTRLRGWIDDELLFDVTDAQRPLTGGGVALICEEGRMATDTVTVKPAG